MHLQPFEPILLFNFSNFSLSCPRPADPFFLYSPGKSENEKFEFLRPCELILFQKLPRSRSPIKGDPGGAREGARLRRRLGVAPVVEPAAPSPIKVGGGRTWPRPTRRGRDGVRP